MTLAATELRDKYLEFTKDSLSWCIKESEESTGVVSKAVDELLQNTNRVSQISQESIDAIQGMQKKLKLHVETGASVQNLIDILKSLANDHVDVQTVIHPIIESLQFQDRLRQNLENCEKMMAAWLNARGTFSDTLSSSDLHSFGETLLSCTTMKEERDAIRHHITSLPEEEEQASVTMF